MDIHSFRLQHRRWWRRFIVLLVGLAAVGLGALIWMIWKSLTGQPIEHLRELGIATVGGLAALLFFLYKQHHDETTLFVDLFRDFNARFDALNDPLNRIAEKLEAHPERPLRAAERQVLFDYFNLCAEEHLFASAGYIDPAVWTAWRRGMRHFASVPAIRALWTEELTSGSYYGFTLSLVDRD
jgi:hypothetical protein